MNDQTIERARQAAQDALRALSELRRACAEIHGEGQVDGWTLGGGPLSVEEAIAAATQQVRLVANEVDCLSRGVGDLALPS